MANDASAHLFPFDQPCTYSIWVDGHLDPSWSDRLGGMGVQPSIRKDGTNITRLRGELPDQAALVGLLNYLYQMRFVVLMVVRTGEEADSALDP